MEPSPLKPTERGATQSGQSAAAVSATAPIPASPRRVLIVEDETLVGLGLRSHLEKLGHTVVGQAANEAEACALFRSELPDLVLMDVRLDHTDGVDLAVKLLAERRVAMVIVSAYSDDALLARASAAGVFGYLVKPVTRESLAAQIAIAVSRFNETEAIRTEKESLAQTLETRKLVEKAKGILMKRLNLDEAAAHKRLQTESQKRRVSMADIARRVIDSENLLRE